MQLVGLIWVHDADDITKKPERERVGEASRPNIPVGLDLAAMGSQCLLCGDPGQLRPYSHIQLLAAR